MSFSDIKTPKATGAIASVSGVTTTVSGVTPASNWAGRIIAITQESSNAFMQWRKIISVSGQVLTLQHTWDTSPIVGYTEVLPEVGEAFVISYTIDELVAGYADFTKLGDDVYTMNFARFSNGAYLFMESKTFQFRTSRVSLHKGAGCIFGSYELPSAGDAITIKSCTLMDYVGASGDTRLSTNRGERPNSSTPYNGSWGKLANGGKYPDALSTPNESGTLEIWGGVWDMVTESTSQFCYPIGAQDKNRFRLVNMTFSGNLSGRFNGVLSAFVSVNMQKKTLGVGWNPTVDVARFELSTVLVTGAIYLYLILPVPSLIKVGSLLSTGSLLHISSDAEVTISIEVSETSLDALTAITSSNSQGQTRATLNLGSAIRPIFTNPDTSIIQGEIKTAFKDKDGVVVNAQSLSSGDSFSEYLAIRYTKKGLGRSLQKSSMSQRYPFTFTAVSYTKELLVQVTNALDSFTPALTLFDDTTITETDKSVVDAYATIDTFHKLYDRSKAYLVDNYAGESALLCSRQGATLDAGVYNVVIDKTASSVFAFDGTSLTIKASTFTGNITTTGAVTLQGGAKIEGVIIDENGDSALTFIGVDSWVVYSSAPARASETGVLDSGIGAKAYRFSFASGATYYLALTTAGETIRKQVSPAEKGVSAISLETPSLLIALQSMTAVARDHARAANMQTQQK